MLCSSPKTPADIHANFLTRLTLQKEAWFRMLHVLYVSIFISPCSCCMLYVLTQQRQLHQPLRRLRSRAAAKLKTLFKERLSLQYWSEENLQKLTQLSGKDWLLMVRTDQFQEVLESCFDTAFPSSAQMAFGLLVVCDLLYIYLPYPSSASSLTFIYISSCSVVSLRRTWTKWKAVMKFMHGSSTQWKHPIWIRKSRLRKKNSSIS